MLHAAPVVSCAPPQHQGRCCRGWRCASCWARASCRAAGRQQPAARKCSGGERRAHLSTPRAGQQRLVAGRVCKLTRIAATAARTHTHTQHRRMHTHVLDSLFAPQPASTQRNQPPPPSDALAAAIAALAAAPADCTPDSSCTAVTPTCSPARLFAALYSSSLLANGSFLERLNVGKAAGGARQLAWVSDGVVASGRVRVGCRSCGVLSCPSHHPACADCCPLVSLPTDRSPQPTGAHASRAAWHHHVGPPL